MDKRAGQGRSPGFSPSARIRRDPVPLWHVCGTDWRADDLSPDGWERSPMAGTRCLILGRSATSRPASTGSPSSGTTHTAGCVSLNSSRPTTPRKLASSTPSTPSSNDTLQSRAWRTAAKPTDYLLHILGPVSDDPDHLAAWMRGASILERHRVDLDRPASAVAVLPLRQSARACRGDGPLEVLTIPRQPKAVARTLEHDLGLHLFWCDVLAVAGHLTQTWWRSKSCADDEASTRSIGGLAVPRSSGGRGLRPTPASC